MAHEGPIRIALLQSIVIDEQERIDDSKLNIRSTWDKIIWNPRGDGWACQSLTSFYACYIVVLYQAWVGAIWDL